MKILRNTIFYLLFFIFGLFIGIQYANIIEAGKGQMLAAGAIVLGHGVVGAVFGLIISVVISVIYKAKPHLIILLNKILAVLVICFVLFFWFKYQEREKQKNIEIGCEINSNLKKKNTNSISQ